MSPIDNTPEACDRRGELHAALSTLVSKHGLARIREDLPFVLSVIEADCEEASPSARTRLPAPQLPRPSERGRFVGRETRVPYTCEVIVERPRAILLWIPSKESHLDGEGCWCERSSIVQRDELPFGPRVPPLEEIVVSRSLKWWRGRRRGSDQIERLT